MSTIYFNLRIDEELNDALIKIAKNEGRSKNKQIEQILKEYVRKYKSDTDQTNIERHNNEKAIVNIDRRKD